MRLQWRLRKRRNTVPARHSSLPFRSIRSRFMANRHPLSSTIRLLSLAALPLFFLSIPGRAQSTYHVVDRWTIGGDGGWDYLLADGTAHRLYVTHNARVEVIDTTTGKAVGAVTGLKSTH